MGQILFLCLFSLVADSALAGIFPVKNAGIDAIYGIDDRELITDKSPKEIKKIAEAVALIVSGDDIEKGLFKTSIKAMTLKDNLNMCADEEFISRPSLGACSGFLIAPNILATAGHCFKTAEDCLGKRIVFGVDAKKQSKKGYSVSESDIYSCKKILAQEAGDYRDYAFIQLDRVPKKRTPLKLSKDKKVADDAQVFMIGHPLGLPQMFSKNASISENSQDFLFKTNLDSFEGSSGSPVINSRTFLVEGILVNGQEDFVQDSEMECYRNKTYEGAGGEGVSRINDLLTFLK